MSPLRLQGSSSGFSELSAPAIAGDQLFTLPGTGGTLDRLNRAGNILQVVNATYSTQTTNNTNVFADTGLAATITPTSASSKILILANIAGIYKDTNDTAAQFRLLRGTTSLYDMESTVAATASTAVNVAGSGATTFYLDSPATISATTYKVQFRSRSNVSNIIVQIAGTTASTSTITLLEVAA